MSSFGTLSLKKPRNLKKDKKNKESGEKGQGALHEEESYNTQELARNLGTASCSWDPFVVSNDPEKWYDSRAFVTTKSLLALNPKWGYASGALDAVGNMAELFYEDEDDERKKSENFWNQLRDYIDGKIVDALVGKTITDSKGDFYFYLKELNDTMTSDNLDPSQCLSYESSFSKVAYDAMDAKSVSAIDVVMEALLLQRFLLKKGINQCQNDDTGDYTGDCRNLVTSLESAEAEVEEYTGQMDTFFESLRSKMKKSSRECGKSDYYKVFNGFVSVYKYCTKGINKEICGETFSDFQCTVSNCDYKAETSLMDAIDDYVNNLKPNLYDKAGVIAIRKQLGLTYTAAVPPKFEVINNDRMGEQWYPSAFGYDSGYRVDKHPRILADVNGDGKADIVGFANAGVYVLESTGTEFVNFRMWEQAYGYSNQWRVEKHIRLVDDIDGDGKADIVGFGYYETIFSLSNGDNFQRQNQCTLRGFHYNSGWTVDDHPRFLADVDGDGKKDIVGFANAGVYVSLFKNGCFEGMKPWLWGVGKKNGYGAHTPRLLADVDGDGKEDIVVFRTEGVDLYVSTGKDLQSGGQGFKKESFLPKFGSKDGWNGSDHHRYLADVNGDGKADIVGFGDQGVYVALSMGKEFGPQTRWSRQFGYDAGFWRKNKNLRYLADVNGDGKADIVGFGDHGTFVALSSGNADDGFIDSDLWTKDFSYLGAGWFVSENPRAVADVNGDGKADLVGFGDAAPYVLFSEIAFESAPIGFKNSANSNLCIDAGHFYLEDKQPQNLALTLQQCEETSNQQFVIFSNGSIKLYANPEMCLDIDNGSNGSLYRKITLRSCDDSERQKWSFDNGSLLHVQSDLPIGVGHGCNGVVEGKVIELHWKGGDCDVQKTWIANDFSS